MKIRLGNALLPLNLAVLALVVVILVFPPNVMRIILSLPFALFLPGYALLVALFPRRGEIGATERAVLSLGISFAIVALIGLILNYTPWGIRLQPVVYAVAAFIFVISLIAWYRQRGLSKAERFHVEFRLAMPGWDGGGWDKALSVMLALAILGAVATFGYVAATPKLGERFTEFFILGSEGRVADYPGELAVGQAARVTVGIINREQVPATYRVEVTINGVKSGEVVHVDLRPDEKWEGTVSFTPDRAGKAEEISFLLYKNADNEAYRTLHLWIDVK